MSLAFSPLTLMLCIRHAEELTGQTFVPQTGNQKAIFELEHRYDDGVAPYRKYLDATAATSAEPINAFLQRKGFDIALDSWPADKPSIGVAGVMDVRLRWLQDGTASHFNMDGKRHPAFMLKTGDRCQVIRSEQLEREFVSIMTREGLQVRLMISEAPLDALDLAELAYELTNADAAYALERFNKVQIPCVDLDLKPDISWILGLKTDAELNFWEIVQAAQQVRLGIDRFGLHASEATAVEATLRGMIPTGNVFTLDQPFLCVVTQPGSRVPLFSAYVTPEHWREPLSTKQS